MELTYYEILLCIAETKNLTRTAEQLGYTQPGVSHIIKKMEAEFGFPLIRRHKYGVTLTPTAEMLLPRIRAIMRANEKFIQDVHAINGLEYGKIIIGTYQSVAINLLPGIIAEFEKRHPGIELELREGGADILLQWLDENVIDFAFLSRPYARTLDFISYGKDPLVAVLPENYKKPGKVFPMKDFEGKKFIVSAIGNDIDIHNAIEVSQVSPDIRYSVLEDQTILSMVENDLGVSILTKLICKESNNSVQLVPVDPPFYRDMGIGAHSMEELSPAAKTFVNFAMERIPDIWPYD